MEDKEPVVDYAGQLADRQREVNNRLNMGNTSAALTAALQNPPLGCKDQQTRDDSAALVTSVLIAIKEAEMKKIIDSLASDDLDILMKYVYAGLADGENSTALLKWHAAVAERGGLGCIVRALAERRTI